MRWCKRCVATTQQLLARNVAATSRTNAAACLVIHAVVLARAHAPGRGVAVTRQVAAHDDPEAILLAGVVCAGIQPQAINCGAAGSKSHKQLQCARKPARCMYARKLLLCYALARLCELTLAALGLRVHGTIGACACAAVDRVWHVGDVFAFGPDGASLVAWEGGAGVDICMGEGERVVWCVGLHRTCSSTALTARGWASACSHIPAGW